MKIICLAFLLALVLTSVQAQTTNTYPVTFTATIALPSPTNAPSATAPPIIQLTSDLVDVKLGTRLARFMAAPASFTFTNLLKDTYTTLYIINPGNLPMAFPTNNVFWMNPAPTNQARCALLIEAVANEIWITP